MKTTNEKLNQAYELFESKVLADTNPEYENVDEIRADCPANWYLIQNKLFGLMSRNNLVNRIGAEAYAAIVYNGWRLHCKEFMHGIEETTKLNAEKVALGIIPTSCEYSVKIFAERYDVKIRTHGIAFGKFEIGDEHHVPRMYINYYINKHQEELALYCKEHKRTI